MLAAVEVRVVIPEVGNEAGMRYTGTVCCICGN